MKKTRIFAGLTALLLCFQAGISMTAFAEETETSVQTVSEAETMTIEQAYQEIRDFIFEWLDREEPFIFWLVVLNITASYVTYSFFLKGLYSLLKEILSRLKS